MCPFYDASPLDITPTIVHSLTLAVATRSEPSAATEGGRRPRKTISLTSSLGGLCQSLLVENPVLAILKAYLCIDSVLVVTPLIAVLSTKLKTLCTILRARNNLCARFYGFRGKAFNCLGKL